MKMLRTHIVVNHTTSIQSLLPNYSKWFTAMVCIFIVALAFLFGTTNTAFAQGKPTDMPTDMREGAGGNSSSSSSTNGEIGKDVIILQANDSLIFNLKVVKKAKLYGSSKVQHQAGVLSAGVISLNIDSSLVSAFSINPDDSLSFPVLQRESDQIRSERILFNYKTKRGKFTLAKVQVPEGQLTGGQVKNESEEVVYVRNGIYSPCDDPHPSYYIKARRMKIIDQEQIFFTDAMLYVMDIPYPFVFPFGYIPSKISKKESGLLTPEYTFNNARQRGLGITNFGWFQYFNDYITGQISTDIYTSGSFNVNTRTNYRNNKKNYSGNIVLGYSKNRGLESTDPNFSTSVQQQVQISHTQRISPYANINASVNLRTSNYNNQNSYNAADRAEVSTNSRVNYSYNHPSRLYTFNLNASQSQNFKTNTTDLNFPTASFRLKDIVPFESKTNDKRWYQTMTIRYDNRLQARYRYSPVDSLKNEYTWLQTLVDPEKHREVSSSSNQEHIRAGMEHNISMNTSVFSSSFLNGNFSISMNEVWYPKTIRKYYIHKPDSTFSSIDSTYSYFTRLEEREREVNGFTTARDFNMSLSFSTAIYGVSRVKIGKFEGLRHTMRPNISFNYKPDFSTEFWGYYREIENDTTDNPRKYSIFENGIYGGPSAGRTQSISFSLSNILETKRVQRDSTGEAKVQKIKLIESFNLGTAYNFAADENKLSDLRASFRSNIMKKINLNANASFDFYSYEGTSGKTDKFLLSESGKPFLMNRMSITASTNFRGGRNVPAAGIPYPATYDPYYQDLFEPMHSYFNEYDVDPLNSEWTVRLNLSYSINRSWNRSEEQFNWNRNALLRVDQLAFNLTPNWKFSTSLSYDIIEKDFATSQFRLNRNINCWNLSFTMNPFGDFKYYMFRLSVSDSKMASLFNKLPILKNLTRSNSPINRSL